MIRLPPTIDWGRWVAPQSEVGAHQRIPEPSDASPRPRILFDFAVALRREAAATNLALVQRAVSGACPEPLGSGQRHSRTTWSPSSLRQPSLRRTILRTHEGPLSTQGGTVATRRFANE